MKFQTTVTALLVSAVVQAQTLFTYGTDSVSLQQFTAAYQKNKTAGGTTLSPKDYLQLYLGSRLKIKEAYARRYDTLPQLKADMEALRAQILPNYVTDEEAISALVKEAFERGKKDVRLSHIFLKSSGNDTTLEARKEAVLTALNQQSFAAVAQKFSDDPAAKSNGGSLGWVTVFSLPYLLENIAYTTAPGQTSAAFKSAAGYHIFKVEAVRPAAGAVQAAQILLAFPPDAPESQKNTIKRRADSVYNRLLKGGNFSTMATSISDDAVSAQAGGQMPQFGVGQYNGDFEKAVYSLQKINSYSKPFQTTHGWHIVKLLRRVPPPHTFNATTAAALKEKVMVSDRSAFTSKALVEKIKNIAPFSKRIYSEEKFWAVSEAVLNNINQSDSSFRDNTVLFQLRDKDYVFNDWLSFAQVHRFKSDGTGVKSNAVLWEEFVQNSSLDFYKENLEQYNPQFKAQMDEFKEGNLFFEIMQQQIWTPASADTIALQDYFNDNKAKYTWAPGAAAIVFYVSDSTALNPLLLAVKKQPKEWRQVVSQFSDKAAADSGHFEWSGLPASNRTATVGSFTKPVINHTDGTAIFAYLIKPLPGGIGRTFTEARAQVITDYQNLLEARWLAELKQKYPVQINEALLDSIK